MQQLGNDRAALSWVFAHGGGVVEASRFLEDCGLFEIGVGRVVVGAGGIVFEFELVECVLNLGEEVVHCEAFFLLVSHGVVCLLLQLQVQVCYVVYKLLRCMTLLYFRFAVVV